MHQLPIGIGERVSFSLSEPRLSCLILYPQYDIIVNTNVGTTGSAYYIRAAMCAASIANVPSDYDIFALAALRYVAPGTTPSTAAPTSSDWSDSDNTEGTCHDFADADLVPLVRGSVPLIALDSVVLVRFPLSLCIAS